MSSDEYKTMLSQMSTSQIKHVSKQVFERLDADQDGSIDQDEFAKLGLSGNRAKKAWKQLDSDKDGKITMDEFLNQFAYNAENEKTQAS